MAASLAAKPAASLLVRPTRPLHIAEVNRVSWPTRDDTCLRAYRTVDDLWSRLQFSCLFAQHESADLKLDCRRPIRARSWCTGHAVHFNFENFAALVSRAIVVISVVMKNLESTGSCKPYCGYSRDRNNRSILPKVNFW